MSALQFHDVSKTFQSRKGAIRALNRVNLQVDEGEVFGFVGPNGAGKSTTIKVMLDIINDYEGDVSIYGSSSRDARSRKAIAYLPESPALYEQFTPLEVLRMALRMNGIRRRDEKAWCQQWLERFSVAPYASRRIRQLSKGNVQRVALAHTLVVQPRLLVLDEPLSGLDPVGRQDVVDILLEYKHAGGAIFFTSHVLHDVERIADRFGFINRGELITTRSPRELVAEHADRFIVRYQSQSLAEGERLREDEYQQELDQSALPGWLDNLNRHGGRVLSIHPATSLESVFFRILEENSATGPGGR
ncbi:ABC transporter ATP-binding protein [Thiohalophilus thiocyanatoxydans]|uniref:ABC-2 type transport system ATP-binding protein n=1 Tax=Thiohalophilus thiocyanatoxydans TaxID=381308 RepID=A0A4R8IPQ8_9GAMM|nr:ABC transporter ATP-binding protein [Thiohalophilus thiocyanatoxydans]TDY01170.1 ABC-2 type transport system ATP-binding protein [Thiohalophilus thiocyanatoxydans]